MIYPEELVALVKKRAAGLRLEGFVPGDGPQQPKLMLVGEAPGRKEIENAIPFSGQAGKELMASLALAGLTREDIYLTSALRSRPFSVRSRRNKRTGLMETSYPNRTPTAKEVWAHAPILDYEIQQLQPPLIVTVGNIGLQRLLGRQMTVTETHGKLLIRPIQQLGPQDTYQWSRTTYKVIPTYHPAAVFYNRRLQPAIEADWRLIGDFIRQLS